MVGRRRWAGIALVVAACGGLAEKPPITYTRAPNLPDDLVNDAGANPPEPDDSGSPASATTASSADAGTKPSPKSSASSAPAKPPDANLCYKKLSGGCCDDAVVKKRGKNGCPKGYVAAGSCIPRASCP